MNITELLHRPFPWYVSGILVGLMVPGLLLFGNKQFGISSSLRHMCAACLPSKSGYFQYDWKKESWSLWLVLGIFIGGIIAGVFMSNPLEIAISPATRADLMKIGISHFNSYIPTDLFNWNKLLTFPGFFIMMIGGFLVGFGTRYANGCTSGHAIMGLSLLNPGSLVATICFFIGGLVMTWIIFPFIFK